MAILISGGLYEAIAVLTSRGLNEAMAGSVEDKSQGATDRTQCGLQQTSPELNKRRVINKS
jgi:hypothetical protein